MVQSHAHASSLEHPRRSFELIQTIATPSPQARAIVINIPGYQGSIHGRDHKYDKIGQMLAARGIAACVQMPNRLHEFGGDELSLAHDVSTVIRTVLSEARELCATERADIYLMGTSAGGAAMAAVSGHFEQVKKILLIAPAYPTDSDAVRMLEKNLGSFAGELYIACGANDAVVGIKPSVRYSELAKGANPNRLEIIPNCGHEFEGETNGKILGKAPLWAFAGDDTFPSPEGGLALY